jgi:hypothetical protein
MLDVLQLEKVALNMHYCVVLKVVECKQSTSSILTSIQNTYPL